MTTAEPQPAGLAAAGKGRSVHVHRALRLLFAGLAGGLLATLICLVAFWLSDGVRGLGSAALGAGMVLFFYSAGQLVMVRFADAGARTLMAVSMASYTFRVVALGLLLLFYQDHRDDWPNLAPLALFVTTIAVVTGWLLIEVIAFSRLRIGVYDTEYAPPSTAGGDQ